MERTVKTTNKVKGVQDMSNSEILANLRQMRLDRGLSMMKLASMIGVSLISIQLWESGAGKPRPENMEKLRKVLEDTEYLVNQKKNE